MNEKPSVPAPEQGRSDGNGKGWGHSLKMTSVQWEGEAEGKKDREKQTVIEGRAKF